MRSKLRMLAAVCLLAGVTLAGVATASAPSLTITSSRAGQSLALHQNPYLAVAG